MMNGLRNLLLIILGTILAGGLLWGATSTFAQAPEDGLRGWMRGNGGMMGNDIAHKAAHASMHGSAGMGSMMGSMDHESMHASMGAGMNGMMAGMDHGAMHASMHDGEAMPEECLELMGDPTMMEHMTQMMDGDDPMTPEECRQWMAARGISPEGQAQCLEHMAKHHPVGAGSAN